MSIFRTALMVAAVSSLSLATLNVSWADDANTMTIKLKDGEVKVELLPDLAPKHVEQIKALAKEGAYDNVVFHRVIPGFMAQTGDVQYGNTEKGFNAQAAGTGGSTRPDLPAEFSKEPFVRGTVGMARAQSPNSANSQFFIMFTEYPSLNGQYTVVGKVTSGMDIVDKIKKGSEADNGAVENPDKMLKVTVGAKK
ncbi:peptidylprolyl isomerase [Phyllobacterium endophyticum]|uniref:Peptidyl-prolyl cis-trans isomerase n=1 Tax=Phyllobacterium endophyticum TaxID=1149773 RepID=A0A2P7AVU0_9HYPH|nr:peptidylprolyl isomerase [Phyllobacterium endophyticum]MBB3234899.1 cyclophilin family peptidyl-prolyl cis-trans isomerase [Phyllobacterium endophyticum]PSH58319.1 peptidylprolyl isomerase [Phyllobacterium endophyticum]TYR39002.1 peptidylprolyl isomerase [Phyllobacterium endophyticum]